MSDGSGRSVVHMRAKGELPRDQSLVPSITWTHERVQKNFYSKFCRFLEGSDNPNHAVIDTRVINKSSEDFALDKGKHQAPQHLLHIEHETIDKTIKVVDSNRDPLVYYFRRGLSIPFHRDTDAGHLGLDALERLIQVYPPPPPGDNDTRHLPTIRNGYGVYHWAYWLAQGRNKDPTFSRDLLGAGYKLNAAVEAIRGLTPAIQACGALYECIDRENYRRYHDLYSRLAASTPLSLLNTTQRNCWPGMAVLVGLCCTLHVDKRDTVDGWVADMAFGDFDGGLLQIPQIGLQFSLQQGDVIFMRSGLLWHAVSETTRGKRFGMVLFTHQGMHDVE